MNVEVGQSARENVNAAMGAILGRRPARPAGSWGTKP